jgi:hypothetical protein
MAHINEKHLGAKYFIWWKLNEKRPFGLQVWEELETYFQNSFFKNEKTSQYFTTIQNHCKANDKNVLRIIGHSGLGKSRLICEAFRCEKDCVLFDANSKTVLKNKVLYTDVSNISDDIANFIKAINTNHGIIVLDNCSMELHEKIEKEATRTGCNLRFITIDYDVDITKIPKHNCNIIELKNTDFEDVIEKILDNDFGTKFIESEIKQIAKIAEGYPQMAVWIAEGIRDNHADFNEILEDNFIEKVIFGREAKNENDYKILKTCAIFKEFHVLQTKNRMNYHGQELREFDAHFDFIEKHLLKEKFTKQELNAVFEKYIKKGVIERRGNKLLIRPLPIAILLATDWWKEQYLIAQECRDLFEPILKDRFMAEQLAERIVMLKSVENVQSIIEILFDNSPFGQTEVLNTNWGSRFFRAVVEVAPMKMVEVLENAFMDFEPSDYLNFEDGRRNLIWALERLCYREETFFEATKILYHFAVHENEHIANNATGVLLQLFQIYLPNTSVNLAKRLEVLNWAIYHSQNEEYIKFALKIIKKGFQNNHFTGWLGVEQQGLDLPLENYKPKLHNEIWDYWQSLTDLTLHLEENQDDEIKLDAQKIIAEKIDIIISSSKEPELLKDKVINIAQNLPHKWEDLHHSVSWSLKHDKGSFSTRLLKIFEELVEISKPNTLRERIKSIVTKPDYALIPKNENKKNRDYFRAKTESLAIKVSKDLNSFYSDLDAVLFGEQFNNYHFGCRIAKETQNLEIIDKCFEIWTENKVNQNDAFLLGYFEGIENKELLRPYYNKFYQDENLCIHCFRLIINLKPTEKEFFELFDLMDKHQIDITIFDRLTWGTFILDNFDTESLLKFCQKLIASNNKGKIIAINAFHRFCSKHYIIEGDNWLNCKDKIKELILNNNFFVIPERKDGSFELNFSEFVEKFLEDNDDAFMGKILNDSIIIYKGFRVNEVEYFDKSTIKEIQKKIFEKNFQLAWTEIGKSMLEDACIGFNLRMEYNFLSSERIFENQDEGFLFEWAKDNTPEGPKLVANLVPYENTQNPSNGSLWNSLIRKLIDNFGNDRDLLSIISANIGTFSSIGSGKGNYEFRKKLFEELKNHTIKEVKKWAVYNIDEYAKRVRRAEIQDEEV